MQIITPTQKPITIISIGAMQMRFTEAEEIAIAADPLCNVIRSRLFNRKHADLNYYPLLQGVTYIVNSLIGKVNPLNPQAILIVDSAAASQRLNDLFRNGTIEEQP